MPKGKVEKPAKAEEKGQTASVVKSLIKQMYPGAALKDAKPAEVGEAIQVAYKRRKKRDLLIVLGMNPKAYATAVETAIEEILEA